jgi:two-component system chemotaxis response regulator CheB
MKQAGAHTIAQDEETCIVYGMPKEAVKLGGVDKVLPLQAISGVIL